MPKLKPGQPVKRPDLLGNQYAVGNHGGKPMKYTLEQVKEKCATFIKQCENPLYVPTMAGLCLALDISPQALSEWKEREDEYGEVIKRVQTRIERYWESRLAGQAATGAIFWLKNRGSSWRDQTDIRALVAKVELTDDELGSIAKHLASRSAER